MKLSSKILLSLAIILLGGILLSNVILKQEYNKVDKSDTYWNYTNILEQSFKYLKINGGNVTNIVFEQSQNCSVRVYSSWDGLRDSVVKAVVRQDTLVVNFDNSTSDKYGRTWMKYTALVRIFAPKLQYIEGYNTTLKMLKLKQKDIHVNMSGKSQFKVESMLQVLDTLTISAQDAAELTFSISPYLKSDQASVMTLKSVNANMQDQTTLDLQHAQIDLLQMEIGDSASVVLSGEALKKWRK